MASPPDQNGLKVNVMARQSLYINVADPVASPETVQHMILEQLARRGVKLSSILVTSNPGNMSGLQIGQELATRAVKDSAVFHMFNSNPSLPSWDKLPEHEGQTSSAQQLDVLTQKPITWFYDPMPKADSTLSSAYYSPPFASNHVSVAPAKDDQFEADDGPTPSTSVSRTLYRVRKQKPKRGKRGPKHADASLARPRTRAQKRAALEALEAQMQARSNRSEKRIVASIQDPFNFASRVERLGIKLALDQYGHKRQQQLKKRLAKATEKRWRGQPRDLTDDDKMDVITKELEKAFEKL
ncbi:uncharacterized protein Z519_06195 [Cladophialophora bantiana CBS 173.52]|uniref:Uncharacterized protein n=1 Tax=Cladophialophora bantiana (strain ATCC 10958 / CBS 173.52 / CDC B-1940 / NIH 8579) TaxID=1442370 RepID=A0A0D2HRY0_CLAB1|nr:uncharacterized protein Z519_06195 [Cladophialophora bantiana CBS 173.52]KIW93590.1 hypothetical protein Z519_06195 [Cladophialophora bantiana CBS 173.52]